MSHLRRALLLAVAFTFPAVAAFAQIATVDVPIQGLGLKVITTEVTANIDMPATVQTEFGGKQNDQAPAIEGLIAAGDLTGPGLDTPIELQTAPGHQFQIPGLTKEGVYVLQNVRLMRGTQTLSIANPSVCVITVANVLQTSVKVHQLTPEELRARGINIDGSNFDVFDYTFSFILDGKEVQIPFPVIIDRRTHEALPVARENPYALPPVKNVIPPRWSPPSLIPTEFVDEGEELQGGNDLDPEKSRGGRPRIPAALVIPNSFAVLHEFFAVTLMVTNGAPTTSSAELRSIDAHVVNLSNNLRTVKTLPAVSFGQPVPIVEPTTGVTFLVAQAHGEAEWTFEGLKPGTYRLDFELHATLHQDGQVDIPLKATPSGTVVVHDPRFNINFSHPDVVRKGIDYSSFAFITNMGDSPAHIRVTSGVQPCTLNPNGNVCRTVGTDYDELDLAAGEMKSIQYKLRPGVTGHVFATAGTVDGENLTAQVTLFQGVSETGIPLSPATLVMPHYAQYLDQDFVGDYLQLLGLGYSAATAPLNKTTAKFPRVITTDVFTRAVDIARGGQRLFITNFDAAAKRDALAEVMIDLLGNQVQLNEWDQLRRQEKSGRTAGASMTRQLAAAAFANGGTYASFFDAMASDTAHRTGYLAVAVHGASVTGNDRPRALSLVDPATSAKTDNPNELGDTWTRNIPFADLSQFNGNSEAGELAVVGRFGNPLDVVITPSVSGPFSVELIYPNANDGTLMRAHFDLTGNAGEALRIPITRGAASLNAVLPNGGFAATVSPHVVTPAPIVISGARQDMFLDADGHKVSILFNRPVTAGDGVDIRAKLTGTIDFNRDGVVFQGPRIISAAALQDDGRTINVTFEHGLSQNASYKIAVGSLVDPTNSQPVTFGQPVVPVLDNDRPAGIVYGHVIKGDNSPLPGTEVKLQQWMPGDEKGPSGPPQYDLAASDGAFLFEYIWRDIDNHVSGAYRMSATATDGKTALVEGAVRLPGHVDIVNIQFLGRGSAKGVVRYNDGTVVPNARVVAGSTMFDQFRTAITDSTGAYAIGDLPVGPLTFSATDDAGNVTFAATEIATPGQQITQDLSIYRKPVPGTATVYGTVTRSDTGAPVSGAHVGVYTQGFGLVDAMTDAAGHFQFTKVPTGFVTVLASEWNISRLASSVDFDLQNDENKQVNLILSVLSPNDGIATLDGVVLRENPLYPGDSSHYDKVAGALVKIEGAKVVTADDNGVFHYTVPVSFAGKQIQAYDPVSKKITASVVPSLTANATSSITMLIHSSDGGGFGTIRVRLLNASGAPVQGYRVIEPGYPPTESHPAGGGIYEFKNVRVGSGMEIWAVPSQSPPATDAEDTRTYGDQLVSGGGHVDFNGQIVPVTLRLPGQGTVRAKVISDIDLISDVVITYPAWDEAEQDATPRSRTLSTNNNGVAGYATFTKVPAVSYGYSVTAQNPNYGAASAGGKLGFDGDLATFTLQLNRLTTVRGTVYAIDGRTPVTGASVTINNGRIDVGTYITDATGQFVFPNQPPGTGYSVVARVTQSGIFRMGLAYGGTLPNGGTVETNVVLRRRGNVEGRVVYADYKKYDPNNPANNIADDTPNDLSDNAPVPLANFYLKELDFPFDSFGKPEEPRQADLTGHFALTNVFVGPLRASAWDSANQELRGNWAGSLDEEGQTLQNVYIAIGGGGTGSVRATVVDPNASYAPVLNAEVSLFRASGGGAFDFGTTDSAGSVQFDQLPIGNYTVSAYSKALGKSGASQTLTVAKDQTALTRITLDFSGAVDGKLVDPEANNRGIPGAAVTLNALNYSTRASTDTTGAFTFGGVREGSFTLTAKDTDSNRKATASHALSASDPHPFVTLELEPTATIYVKVDEPNDAGNDSGILSGPVNVEVAQRCANNVCDFYRELQGNPVSMPQVLANSEWKVTITEIGGLGRKLDRTGTFPLGGSASNPVIFTWPAYGSVKVDVVQAGAPAAGAKVVVGFNGGTTTLFTDGSGSVTAHNVRLGGINVQAVSVDGRFSAYANANLGSQSNLLTVPLTLASYAGVTGSVIAEAGGPSAGTRVIANFGGSSLQMMTDSNGKYTFQGIPTTVGSVNFIFYGPDDTTVGAYASVPIKSTDAGTLVPVPEVHLDATPPQIISIVPADGATNVSPDAPVSVLFSEPIGTQFLNNSQFALFTVDGVSVNAQITTTPNPDGTYLVTLTPPPPPAGQRFKLLSNTLYRFVVSGSITDLTGHPLPAPKGITFTTSDYSEPRVVKVTPSVTTPLQASTTFNFQFNEAIDPAPWQTGGNGVFHLYKISQAGPAGTILGEVTGHAYVDPVTNVSLLFAPDVHLEPESYYRVVFSGIRDLQGNVTAEQTFHFYSFDQTPPFINFVSPIPSGTNLISGNEYTLGVDLRNGTATGTPATDVQQIDYYYVDGTNETYKTTIKASPFGYKFIAPDAPAAGAPLTIRGKARDLSGNDGPPSDITFTVKPNAAPTNVTMTLTPTGAIYPGAPVTVTVAFDDEGTFCTLQVDASGSNSNGTTWTASQTGQAQRANITAAWPAKSFTFTLPITLKPGMPVTFNATVTDVQGLSTQQSTTLTPASDTGKPSIVSVTPQAGTTFAVNAKYNVVATVSDAETGVQSVTFTVDGVSSTVTTSTAGPSGTSVFTSPQITVVSRSTDTKIPITVLVTDYSGNTQSSSFEVTYAGVNDPNAPSVFWLSPIDHAAVVGSASQTLKLRVRATDAIQLTGVGFYVGDDPLLKTATLVSGTTDQYEYTLTSFTPPAPGTPFTIKAHATNASHATDLPISIDLVPVDQEITGTQAITVDNVATFNGRNIVFRGAAAKLMPQVPVTFRNLLIVDGAQISTLPTTTTKEYRAEITVTDHLYIDYFSSADVSAKGYQGGWALNQDGSNIRNNDLHGRTLGNTSSGGADNRSSAGYGGSGGRSTAADHTNATYGSPYRPTDLGSGGGGNASCCTAGNSGGGAIAIHGDTSDTAQAMLVIGGTVRSDGGTGLGSAGVWAAGSGGSVLFESKQVILGAGALVSANGGDDDGDSDPGSFGGGAGRIAISATTHLDSVNATITARGGHNTVAADSHNTLVDGGAGTILLRRPGQTRGELTVNAYDSRYPNTQHLYRPTPIGAIGSGTSTAIAANSLTDTTRTFNAGAIGESIVLAANPAKSFTVTGVSSDGKTLQTDPADGSLLAVATSQTVAYSGLLRFDKVTAGPRALVRFDDSVEVNGVPDQVSSITTDPTAAVLLRADKPSINLTTNAANGSVIRNTDFIPTYTATSKAGVNSVTLTWSPLPSSPHTDTFGDSPITTASKTFTFNVSSTTALGPATLTSHLADRADRVNDVVANFNVVDNTAPVITSYDVTPASMYAGHTITAVVGSSDDVSVKSVTLTSQAGSATPVVTTHTPNALTSTDTFTVTIPNDTPNGTTVNVDAAVSDNYPGRAATTQRKTVSILADNGRPTLTVISPTSQDAPYNEGSNNFITVSATASDAEVDVKDVVIQFDGGTPIPIDRIGTSANFSKQVLVPSVDGTTQVTVTATITAHDYAGNATVSAPITLHVNPLIDALAPAVSWACSSTAAMYPPNTQIKPRVYAIGSSPQNGVQTVTFNIDGTDYTGVAVTGQANYYETQNAYTIPARADSSSIPVNVTVQAAGGHVTTLKSSINVAITDAPDINPGTNGTFTIDASNAATYDNHTFAIKSGTVTIVGSHTFNRMMVLGGNVLHAGPSGSNVSKLDITATGGVYVSCDGQMNVTGRGYNPGVTYTSSVTGTSATIAVNGGGGSHTTRGGTYPNTTTQASTFDSIYHPNEAGGGGDNAYGGTSGGGVIRIKSTSGNVVVDGKLIVDGNSGGRGGAGGSVWITANHVGGGGTISADGGGTGCCGAGGGAGGAISLEYTDVNSVSPAMHAIGGSGPSGWTGTPGTIYVAGPTGYGDLTINHASTSTMYATTDFPSLGSGTAQATSSGATLVTLNNVPTWFQSHWVEISTPTGTLKGTYRIDTVNGKTLTLKANGTDVPDVQPNDKWQGVYRFDNLHLAGPFPFVTTDPFRIAVSTDATGPASAGSELGFFSSVTTPKLTLNGWVSTKGLSAGTLTVNAGSVVTHPQLGSGQYTPAVVLTATDTLTMNGAINVNDRGYPANVTYPNEPIPGFGSGGSHLGRGGRYPGDGLPPPSYGSVYQPREGGSGGDPSYGGAGGAGIVELTAPKIFLNGPITANAPHAGRGGGGGSIYIHGGTIISTGASLSANGGDTLCCGAGAGGGGAIAVEYTDAGSTLPSTQAYGAAGPNGSSYSAGAGTIYVKGPGGTYGNLTVDNNGVDGLTTDLPSLGSGTAQANSTGTTLVTGRTSIQPYFANNWVEITSHIDGTVKAARIDTINGGTLTLKPKAGETLNISQGDTWQGVYYFDNVTVQNLARLTSADPMRNTTATLTGPTTGSGEISVKNISAGSVTITGRVAAETISANTLTVDTTGILTHPDLHSGVTGPGLTLNVTGLLSIKGSIDLGDRGYDAGYSYPGDPTPQFETGGSHFGRGGVTSANTTSDPSFGNVEFPAEAGGGADSSYSGVGGSGFVRITAGTVQVDGSIKSIGTNGNRGGAGGSVWITTGKISGNGTIDAGGGSQSGGGAGGGGGIAIEYTDASSVLPVLKAIGGTSQNSSGHGGAGTIVTKAPGSTYGNLLIDNGTLNGGKTDLPSLGRGQALNGTTGNTLVTDRAGAIPAYFKNHWIDITTSGGAAVGSWRIDTIVNSTTVTLKPNGNETISLQPGYNWTGAYWFDNMTVKSDAVRLSDALHVTGTTIGGSQISINAGAPVFDPAKLSQITVLSDATGDYVVGPAGAVTDPDGTINLTVTNTTTGATYPGTTTNTTSFKVPVGGRLGQTFTIRATDSHALPLTSAPVAVNGSITNGINTLTFTSSQLTGGTTTTGSVRLLYPARNGTGVVQLSSNSSSATVPSSITIADGQISGAFTVTTTAVSQQTNVTITATCGASGSGTLTLLGGSAVLTAINLSQPTIESGGVVNGTAVLGAPAPTGGAIVMLTSSDTRLATVPQTVVVPEGQLSAPFSITTYRRNFASSVSISGVYGASASASLSLTACTAMTSVTTPSSTINNRWIDDAIPGGTAITSPASFESTYAASGTSSIHFPSTPGARVWGFTGATTTLTVAPTDYLVFYALVNPCDPPRQILAVWKDAAKEYRASWGEDMIDATTTRTRVSAVPDGGQWVRFQILAKLAGVTASTQMKDFTIKIYDGEAWFDAIGTAGCTIASVPRPASFPVIDQNWWDDAAPAGASLAGIWSWDTTFAASGTQSNKEPLGSGFRQHYFEGATDTMKVGYGDVLYTYVLIDPCNPPRQILLQWNVNGDWSHRAVWGENLQVWGSSGTYSQRIMGVMPDGGQWVRLEVPAYAVNLENKTVSGMAMGIWDGQAWFDRAGRYSRPNLALGKTATESSVLNNDNVNYGAQNAVDGNINSFNHTQNNQYAWLDIDLGSVQPIDTVVLQNRVDCCQDRLSNFELFLSDNVIPTHDMLQMNTLPGVSFYQVPSGGNLPTMGFEVHRTARYLRVQFWGSNYLHIAEVQVYTSATFPTKVNLGSGNNTSNASSYNGPSNYSNLAVNARTNDLNFNTGSIFMTQSESQPYWQIDLGAAKPISTIEVYNRQDGNPERLQNAYVFVSNDPFTGRLITDLTAQSGVGIWNVGTAVVPLYTFDVNRVGRYVRVQLPGTNILQLPEVVIWSQQAPLAPLVQTQPNQ